MNGLNSDKGYGEAAQYLFHQGTNFSAYDYMGCHTKKSENGFIYSFRVWAPRASEVRVIGDVFGWEQGLRMDRITETGIWELETGHTEDLVGSYYKYKIISDTGVFLKADPYAFSSQTLGDTASVITDIEGYEWADNAWMKYRSKLTDRQKDGKEHFYPHPLNIYEVHLGSWKTRNGGSTSDRSNYLSYSEIADDLIPYVK
ncbi:MAG: hypothetical protein IKU19_00095, partial [Clostridia bacterium]|nr:hypothetical protein [Clostridia bacterium]